MSPKINTVKKGGSRFYIHPSTRNQVPGVTSVVGMLPKEFLKFWAAKMTAECAVDNIGAVVNMVSNGDREGAIDYLKRAHFRNTGKASDTGTDVHTVVEGMARGNGAGRLHPDIQVYADHFQEYLDLVKPNYLFLEETVWSEKHGYAGSFDGIAEINGEIIIVDNKTTRSGVHAEVALQLAAYANADYILHPDGSHTDLPEIEGAAVLHLRPEGWKLVPVAIGPDVFATFLSMIPVLQWERELSKSVLGNPLTAEDFKGGG